MGTNQNDRHVGVGPVSDIRRIAQEVEFAVILARKPPLDLALDQDDAIQRLVPCPVNEFDLAIDAMIYLTWVPDEPHIGHAPVDQGHPRLPSLGLIRVCLAHRRSNEPISPVENHTEIITAL
jgi:hypothetical protein